MNTNPLITASESLHSAADKVSSATSSAMEAGREKLAHARDVAQQKLESASETAAEAMNVAKQKVEVAREKIDQAGSNLLQWARENPATALATFFASGFVIGAALTLRRNEKSFNERLREDPLATLRDTITSALTPLRERIHDATDSAHSKMEKMADRVAANGHSLGDRLRSYWS